MSFPDDTDYTIILEMVQSRIDWAKEEQDLDKRLSTRRLRYERVYLEVDEANDVAYMLVQLKRRLAELEEQVKNTTDYQKLPTKQGGFSYADIVRAYKAGWDGHSVFGGEIFGFINKGHRAIAYADKLKNAKGLSIEEDTNAS